MALAIASLVLLVPVWFTTHLPLLDWPNHLARAYILARYHEVPQFEESFMLRFDVLPNLASDVIGMLLLRYTSYIFATKIILSLVIIIFAAGCFLVSTGLHGRIGVSTILSLFFVYNFMFLYGFVNYMLGMGLFLVTYGYWLRCLERWTIGRATVLLLLSLTCYFAHLSSFVFLAIAVVTHTALQLFTHRRTIFRAVTQAFIPLALPMLAFAIYQQRYTGQGNSSSLRWEGLYSKLKGFAYLFSSYDFGVDFLFAGLLLLLFFVCLKFCRVQYSIPAIVVSLVLFAVFMFAPVAGFVGVWGIDRRFVIPAAVLFFLSAGSACTYRFCRLLTLLALMLLTTRAGWIWSHWAAVDAEISAQVQLFRKVFSPGSRVYPVTMLETRDKREWVTHMPFRHTICYSVIVSHAFVPSLFAYSGQQPVRFKIPDLGYQELSPPFSSPETVFHIGFMKRHYDYIYGYRLSKEYEAFLNRHFQLIVRQGKVWIFRTGEQSLSTPPPPHPSPGGIATGDSPTRAAPPGTRR
jgi:hypothetical protein